MSMFMSIGGGDGTGDTSGLPNHYEILGVDEQASEGDIKRAYFRLVREFRPQENPEDFQKFNDASKTLSDPRRRGAYDQTRRNGRRVQVLVDQAANAQDKDPQKAIAILKNAIALAPDVSRPRLLLAQVLIRLDEFAAAEKQYRWLIKDNPRDETLYFKVARSLLLQEKPEEAEEALRRALQINSRYHDAMMLLARLREQQGASKEAAELLEQAIANDGRENYADAEALLRLLVLYLGLDESEAVERTAQRILSVVPAENEEWAYQMVQRLLQRANDQYHAEKFSGAKRLLGLASQISLANEELIAQREALEKAVAVRAEARQVQGDTIVGGALKAYLELRYLDKAPESMRQKLDVLFTQLQTEIASQPRELSVMVDYLRREYPAIAKDQERLLAELSDRAARRINSEIQTREVSNAMPEVAEPAPSPEERTTVPAKKGLLGWLRGGPK